MKRAFVILISLVTVGCGLADDERDEENKLRYLTFYDRAFEAFCLESYDLDHDDRISHYEAQRVLSMDCSAREIASLSDLTAFTRLRTLRCATNRLTELDLSACPQLEEVDCSENALASVRLGTQRNLTSLVCRSNPIAALNLSTCGSLRVLDARAMRLVTLDVSTCSRTVSRIDVRDCELLTTLYCLAAQQHAVLTSGATQIVVQN